MAITAVAQTAASATLTPTFTFGFTATAGDLLVMAMGVDFNITGIAWPAGWTELRDDAVAAVARSSIAYKIAAGGETTVLPVGSGVADRWEGVLWRVPVGEWHGTTAPEVGAPAATTTVNPNPPSITPSWGSETNNVYIAMCMRDDSVANTISAYPTNYSTAQLDNNATTSGCNCGGGVRIVTGSPEDPGTFTISAAEDANAYTVAVRPAAAGVTVTPTPFALVFTGFAPIVTASDHKTVTPTPFATVWTGFAPVVTASDHKVVTPSPFALAWQGFAPDVQISAGGSVTVTPDPFALAWAGFAPTVVATDNKLVTPTPFALAWAGFAPAVVATNHQRVTPDPFALLWAGFAPTVAVSGGEGPSRLQIPIGTSRGRPVG